MEPGPLRAQVTRSPTERAVNGTHRWVLQAAAFTSALVINDFSA